MKVEKSRRRLKRHPFAGQFTYDAEVDAAYIYLNGPIAKGGVAKTMALEAKGHRDIYLDFDKEGRLLGVELLGISYMPRRLARAIRTSDNR